MRSSSRLAAAITALSAVFLASAPLLAAQPAPDAPRNAPAATPAPTGTPAPAPTSAPSDEAAAPPPPSTPPAESRSGTRWASPTLAPGSGDNEPRDELSDAERDRRDPRRGEGVRLALDLGFQRAVHEPIGGYDVGTPTLLPLGADVSYRLSPYTMVGIHGYAALASRDDCIAVDSCRARAYGAGAHFENVLGRGASFQPWIRYGMGFEMLYHGGAPVDAAGHEYRDAIDFMDLRVGGDFIVGRGSEKKTTRIGAFLGFTGGVLVGQSGVSYGQTSPNGPISVRNLDDQNAPVAHLWFQMGVRASIDP